MTNSNKTIWLLYVPISVCFFVIGVLAMDVHPGELIGWLIGFACFSIAGFLVTFGYLVSQSKGDV